MIVHKVNNFRRVLSQAWPPPLNIVVVILIQHRQYQHAPHNSSSRGYNIPSGWNNDLKFPSYFHYFVNIFFIHNALWIIFMYAVIVLVLSSNVFLAHYVRTIRNNLIYKGRFYWLELVGFIQKITATSIFNISGIFISAYLQTCTRSPLQSYRHFH